MSRTAVPRAPGAPRRPVFAAVVLVALLGAATVAAAYVGDSNPWLALAPVVGAVALYLVAVLPLRFTTTGFIGALLAIDTTMVEGSCPSGLVCRWRTPLVFVGDLLHGNLAGGSVSGMEAVTALLFGIWFWRRVSGSTIDEQDRVKPASVIRELTILYVVAVLFAEANGLARGGEVAAWKLRNLLHPIALFLLVLVSYRGPRDYPLLGRALVFAATFRAALAVIIQAVAKAQSGGPLESGTSHGDSLLFAVGMFILVAELMERPTRGRATRAMALLPILIWGTVANDRRLAWVMVAMMLGLAYFMSPWRGWKRKLTRAVATALPVVALYVAVGWNREGFLFRPVRIFRSVSDTSVDHSAYWREVENWNIITSMKESPVIGIGLGRSYTEHMRNDDITADYQEFRQWPHNTILGLLLFFGVAGFSAMWLLPVMATYLAARSYRVATDPGDRVVALSCVAAVLACHVLAWGDTGAHFPQFKIIQAITLAVSAQLAVATGAWPAPRARRAAAPREATPA